LPDGRFYKANYTLNLADDDIIIIGSSRAEYNYIPKIIEDSLKMSCWNAGRGGQSLPYWYAMAKSLTSRYNPKVVIINVEPLLLSETNSQFNFERMGSMLRPFYRKNPEIRPILDSISKFEKFKIKSNFYAYNSTYYYLFRPFLVKNVDGKLEDKGWKTKNKEWNIVNSEMKDIYDTTVLNSTSMKFFQDIISLFDLSKTKVYVVVSPDYGVNYVETGTLNYIQKINGITVINLGKGVFNVKDNNCFQDPQHLNKKGAAIFTSVVSHHLLKDFNH
jgi:hypothetical protein